MDAEVRGFAFARVINERTLRVVDLPVVIENDDHALLEVARAVHGLVRHATWRRHQSRNSE